MVPWRATSSRVADAIGLALLVYLLWRVFFGVDESFDRIGAAVGIAGITSAWLGRRTLRTVLDGPIALYLVLLALSNALNAGRFPQPMNIAIWQPPLQTAILVAFFYGTVQLLRTPIRLALFSVVLVVAISVVGVEASYDFLTLSVAWRRIGYYPSVGQWSGYPQLGMLFTVAFPLPLAALMCSNRRSPIVAASVVAVALLLDLVFVNSRITYLAAGVTYLTLALTEIVKFRRFRLLGIAVAAVLCVVVYSKINTARGGTFAYWWQTRLYLQYGSFSGPAPGVATGFGRFEIWRHADGIIRGNPWIGVGPGHYFEAVRSTFADWHYDDIHAHNTFLHTAAETGIPSAIVLLAMWGVLFKHMMSGRMRSDVDSLRLGFAGALVAFFMCSMSDHFTAYGLAPRNRIAFLTWALVAAGVASVRASRAEARA